MNWWDSTVDWIDKNIVGAFKDFVKFIEDLPEQWNNLINYVRDGITNVWNEIIYAIKIAIAKWFYEMLKGLLIVVDTIEDMFDVFAGLTPVTYNPPGGESTDTYITDLFINYNPITQAFWLITAFAATLCLFFTIVMSIRSAHTMALDGKDPIGKVLGRGARSALIFALIPVMTLALLNISTIVLTKSRDAITVGVTDAAYAKVSQYDWYKGQELTTPSIGTLLFIAGSLSAESDAAKAKINQYGGRTGYTDYVRAKYFYGISDWKISSKVYADFNILEYNLAITILLAILMIIFLFLTAAFFVRRLFEICMLYVVAPFFAAVIPVDDGQMFAKWREMFVAKFFSGFGCVIVFRLYLLLIPFIVGTSLTLGSSWVVDVTLKILLVCGGAWAVYKSQFTILRIINYDAYLAAEESVGSMIATATAIRNEYKTIKNISKGGRARQGGSGGGSGQSGGGGSSVSPDGGGYR